MVDHHSRILRNTGLSEYSADKIEYNPITKELKLDSVHSSMHKYLYTYGWNKAWFSRKEILNTLESMPLTEMLPKGVHFNKVLYEKLVKKESTLYSRYGFANMHDLWSGMQGFRKSLTNVLWIKCMIIGLCLSWKGESVKRLKFKQEALNLIKL